MRRIIRQCIRGCTKLPHVGEHPGTGFVIFLIFATGAAGGSRGGILGFMVAAGVGLLVYGPMYLFGAYDRAQISDRMEGKSDGR